MKRANFILLIFIIGFTAYNRGQVIENKALDNTGSTKFSDSNIDVVANNSENCIYVGQKINEFIAIAEQQYSVKKEFIRLEGDDYDVYNVYENEQKLYSVEPDDNPNIIWRIWIYSPKFTTEKGIGVGSTFADLKSKYQIDYIQTEEGLSVIVKEIEISFTMNESNLPNSWWEDGDKDKIPDILPIERIIIIGDTNIYITHDNKIISK